MSTGRHPASQIPASRASRARARVPVCARAISHPSCGPSRSPGTPATIGVCNQGTSHRPRYTTRDWQTKPIAHPRSQGAPQHPAIFPPRTMGAERTSSRIDSAARVAGKQRSRQSARQSVRPATWPAEYQHLRTTSGGKSAHEDGKQSLAEHSTHRRSRFSATRPRSQQLLPN